MKKTFGMFGLVALLIGLVFMQPSGLGYAQGEAPPTPTATPYPGESGFVTFAMLGLEDEIMVGPYANSYIRFSTPDSWAFQPGATLVLELDTTVRSSRVFTEGASEYSGALLEVTLNDHILENVFLTMGPQTIELAIPEEALVPTRADGRHSLQIYLNAAIDCLFDHETSVVLRNTSGFSLPHTDTSPIPELALLPRPIFKEDSILPEELVIVVPDAPTVQELQASMTVAAAFGRMSQGAQVISLASVSTLSQLQKNEAHLVMVGKPDVLPLLKRVTFPVISNAAPGDGVIQMGISPWNASRVVLYIGGEKDDSVVKAAQAFSSGSLRTGKHYSLSVVSSVAEAVEIKDVEDDRTLKSLGYMTRTLSGVGYSSFEYEFVVPLGKMPTEKPRFDLRFTHSASFDFDSSGAVILLNDEPLGSIRFMQETANQINTMTISIPTYAIKPGRNVITVQAEFIPTDYCSILNDTSLWLSISEDSLLHIPLVDAEQNSLTSVLDLAMYPVPFADNPTLAETGFIFPLADVYSWDLGAKIAANLGQYAVGKIITPAAFYADNISNEDRQSHHFILVGRASQLPIIDDLKDSMPAHFEAVSDMAVEDDSLITYSIPEGTDLGYLELFASPWNATHKTIAIMGSTPQGLMWAKNALLNPELKTEIIGDYVVVQGERIYAIDTKASGLGTQNLSATAVPNGSLPIIPDTVPVTAHAYQQNWVEVAIVVTTGGIVLLLLGIALNAFFKKRRDR